MKHSLVVLMCGLGCMLSGCGGSPPALSLRQLYKDGEKPAVEARLEGEWTPVSLSNTGVNEETTEHWTVTAQNDGCYLGERLIRRISAPRSSWSEWGRCLQQANSVAFEKTTRSVIPTGARREF